MKKYAQYSDETLVEMLRQGDSDVMEYLVDKYKNMVRQKARMLFLVGGDQDDLIQEGMIGLFKAVRDYQPDREASFYTFAQLCVDRQLYHAIEASNRQKHQPLNTYVSLNAGENENELKRLVQQSPENIVIDKENAKNLDSYIRQQLSSMENQVLELYLNGENYLEIGEKLGKPAKSIDNALQRIRSKVRQKIVLDFFDKV